ncbi:hypothetical protein Val02_74200 [Virgisporangium aliadipatigenens]|uniref:Cytosolic protein n=1 Tax=Virgisporangium aliadipatigenens TaxID=741659 RepID=A0A8J3YRU4_9ACTN|nr:DUF6282 family protein [Virgisporangium aliadipatigenens]GIJ50534.1 hypothetical protein Val02_74200 [Virgisporangium aliadipatigenens]
MTDHPTPTARARELVAGAYDTHIHVAPDVMPRRVDDVSLARRFAEVGLAGFVLKSHYVPTAERAEVVRAAVPGVDALGALTLNGSVGGLNPVAVEIAGRQGARVVWLPTVDCANQRECQARDPAGAKPPMWAQLQEDLARQGIQAPAIDVLDAEGAVVPALRQVLALIAKHDMVLATGHLSGAEISAVVAAAAEGGVRRIVVTHPEFTSQRLPVRTQRALAEQGALMERCFTTPYTGKVAWETLFDHIRRVGPEHSLLSSDLGQPFNPPVEDGLALLADRLLEAGFTEAEVHTMAVTNTRRIGAAPQTPGPGAAAPEHMSGPSIGTRHGR